MKISNLASKTKNVKYTYIENNSKNICFMLSGSGYTYEKPLLYYSTVQLIEAQFDFVQIHYSYDSSYFKMNIEDFINIIIEDVDSVIMEVLATKQYEQIIILGKSLGTLPIVFKYSKTDIFRSAKLILYTPLFKVEGLHEKIMESPQQILMVIGTEDGNFIESSIVKLRQKDNVSLIEIEGANHKLEIEPINTEETIKVMARVIEAMHQFISNE